MKSANRTQPLILIVDNCIKFLSRIKYALIDAGYRVITSQSPKEVIWQLEKFGLPDLAVINVKFYDAGGKKLCQRVQQISDFPVIMLDDTHRSDVAVKMLQTCADDYLTKLVSPEELTLRVQNFLGNSGRAPYEYQSIVRLDENLQIDFLHSQLIFDGGLIKLTRLETKLLFLLIKNPGITLTSGTIISRLWPVQNANERTLRVHVSNLRSKLKQIDDTAYHIQTVQGTGYAFMNQPNA